MLNIWSTLSPYFTAKFRNEDPTLLLIYTLYAYPIAIGSMTVSMQLGALLFGKIDMRLQLFIGTVIYCAALFLSQFMETYTSFLFVFAVMGGFGFGIIFFLPIGCVWSFFPLHKPYVAGAVLSWCALSSCYYYYMTPMILNPTGEKPQIIIPTVVGTDRYFAPDSPQVQALPELLSYFSLVAFAIMCTGIPFIKFNYKTAAKKKNATYS